jgi:threonine/homoserine/homoserine lactone efflux protein
VHAFGGQRKHIKGNHLKALFKGLLTGLFLQLAIGPVFFFVLGITINSNFVNVLFAITAVTLVDFIYISLSLLGLSKVIEKDRIKTIVGIVSSIVLIGFSLVILKNVFNSLSVDQNTTQWNPLKSFASCFLLTITSPLTIVFWTGIFSAKAIEYKLSKKQLVIFGIGAGCATFIFMSLTMLMISVFRTSINVVIIKILNSIVGILLLYYAISRLIKIFTDNRKAKIT